MANFFNKNLKYVRRQKNISQQEIANKLKIDRSTISRWENEEMEATVDRAVQVADVLGVPVDLFLSTDMSIFDSDSLFELELGTDYKKVLKVQNIREQLNEANIENEKELGIYVDVDIDEPITPDNFSNADDYAEKTFVNFLKKHGIFDKHYDINPDEVKIILDFIKNNSETLKILIEKCREKK